MSQRIKITPSNLKTWTLNIQSFLERKMLQGSIPEKLEGSYVCFQNDGTIRVREPSEIILESCPKCGGSGMYLHYGVCYDCKGKGYLTFADQMRDSYYHEMQQKSNRP